MAFFSAILKQSRAAMSNAKLDIHAKLTMSFIWKDDVQLPWWGMLTAFSLASSVALPLGVIQATTNQVR